MMKNNNVGKLRRNLKIYFGKLVKMLKNAIVEVPKDNDDAGIGTQVQTTGTGTGPQTSTTTPSTAGTGASTGAATPNPTPQTIVCLGAKPTTGAGTQPTTPTGPISTTPTTTMTPVPESAAVTDNRNAQVVKATQANQAFGAAFMSGFSPVLQQPTQKQSANIDKANAVTNKPTVTLGAGKPSNPFASSSQSAAPTIPAQVTYSPALLVQQKSKNPKRKNSSAKSICLTMPSKDSSINRRQRRQNPPQLLHPIRFFH